MWRFMVDRDGKPKGPPPEAETPAPKRPVGRPCDETPTRLKKSCDRKSMPSMQEQLRAAQSAEAQGLQDRKKRPASSSPSREHFKRRSRSGGEFWDYVKEVNKKHAHGNNDCLDPILATHSFPPTNLQEETNVKFAQKVLGAIAAGDRTWQLLLILLFQAPDHCWCFHDIMNPLLRGVLAQRACDSNEAKDNFDHVERILQHRADSTMIFGNGESGIYNAEHLTATMKGKTHVQALRIKLETWPTWIAGAVEPLLMSWPASKDVAAIDVLLRQPSFCRKFPDGIRTRVQVSKDRSVSIIELFDGDEEKAYSVVSQALLFAEILKPTDKAQQELRRCHGWGAGPFVIRGLWMDVQKDEAILNNFPQFDSETFCPGFTGALSGATACKLEESTGIALNPKNASAPDWSSWDVQVRFNAWMHALQADQPDDSGPKLHCTELEACLCFFLRYRTMRMHPEGSREYEAASRAIGLDIAPASMQKIFAPDSILQAAHILNSSRSQHGVH